MNSNLYYANLLEPKVQERNVVHTLFAYAKFFEKAKRFYAERKVIANWEIYGYYYSLEPKRLTAKIQKNKRNVSLIFNNKQEIHLKLVKETPKEWVVYSKEKLLGKTYKHLFKEIKNLESLPEVWISIEPIESDESENSLEEFMN
ncbi:MAG: hypothetical protein AAF518_28785, partial [Spirochaetota bacterium]